MSQAGARVEPRGRCVCKQLAGGVRRRQPVGGADPRLPARCGRLAHHTLLQLGDWLSGQAIHQEDRPRDVRGARRQQVHDRIHPGGGAHLHMLHRRAIYVQ
eukprot:scaffold275946_cov35-Tisochrysis_lutea.AAC.1